MTQFWDNCVTQGMSTVYKKLHSEEPGLPDELVSEERDLITEDEEITLHAMPEKTVGQGKY